MTQRDLDKKSASIRAAISPGTPMAEVSFEEMRNLVVEASSAVEMLARVAATMAGDYAADQIIPQLMQRLIDCNSVVVAASAKDRVTLGDGYDKVFGRFGPGFDVMFPARGAA